MAKSSAQLMPHQRQAGITSEVTQILSDLFTYMCFFETKLNPWTQSACLQEESLSCLILQDNSYREQLQTTCNIFTVFFVSFSLSEMPGAQFLVQACCAALHGQKTCPRGLVGVHFLHEEHVQQKKEDFSYSHENLLSSEGHPYQIKYQYLCFSS